MVDTRATGQRSSSDYKAAEASVLERAASGIRDAFGARRVYAATVEEDGSVAFTASSPVDAGVPEPLDREGTEGLAEVLGTAVVAHRRSVPGLGEGFGPFTLVPLVSRGSSIGLIVIDWGCENATADTPVLALIGAQTGTALDAIRHCEELAYEDAVRRDDRSLLEGILQTVPLAVKILDLDGRVWYWNPGCERVYRRSSEDVVGERIPHVPEDMRLRAIQDIRRIASNGRAADREVIAVRGDGSSIVLGLAVAPFVDRDGHPAGVVSVAMELTEESGIGCDEDDLVIAVAQSLKGPLAAIIGFAQLLARPEILDEPSRRTRTIRALEERGNRMASLIDDLFCATCVRNGSLALDIGPCDLAVVVSSVATRFEEEHPTRRLVVDYDGATEPILIDRCRVDRAMGNLLDAAVRHADPESDVLLFVRHTGESVVVEARGSRGDGSACADPSDVQLEIGGDIEDVESRPQSAKLSLYLVRMIAEAHGGGAFVSGKPGEDKVFTLRIPASGVSA